MIPERGRGASVSREGEGGGGVNAERTSSINTHENPPTSLYPASHAHACPPTSFAHVCSQSFNDGSSHSSTSSHVAPSPLNPGGQTHSYPLRGGKKVRKTFSVGRLKGDARDQTYIETERWATPERVSTRGEVFPRRRVGVVPAPRVPRGLALVRLHPAREAHRGLRGLAVPGADRSQRVRAGQPTAVLIEVDHDGRHQHDGAAAAVVEVVLKPQLELHRRVIRVRVDVPDALFHAVDECLGQAVPGHDSRGALSVKLSRGHLALRVVTRRVRPPQPRRGRRRRRCVGGCPFAV